MTCVEEFSLHSLVSNLTLSPVGKPESLGAIRHEPLVSPRQSVPVTPAADLPVTLCPCLTPPSPQVSVLFVDYGNEEQVPVSELRPLSPSLARHPPQAVAVRLTGVQINDASAQRLTEMVGCGAHLI